MKQMLLIFFFISIISGCTKEKNNEVNQTYIYNHRVNISNSRITEISWINADSVLASTKYIFTDSLITVIDYYPSNIEQDRTIYKIAKNGFAESSYTIPEYYFPLHPDTFFTGRLHYNYDSENHMVRADFEVHHAGSIIQTCYFSNEFKNGNLTRYTRSLPPKYCINTIDYLVSGFNSKIDIVNFTNGILGKTNNNLVSSETINTTECGKNNKSVHSEFTYTFDNLGYVIQSKQVSKVPPYNDSPTYIITNIDNYEIHILN